MPESESQIGSATKPDSSRNPNSDEATWRPLLVVLFAWLAILVASFASYAAPDVGPFDDSIPVTEFSPHRARRFLSHLLHEIGPHPAGSPQNDEVRERLVSILQEEIGYDVLIESSESEVDNWFRQSGRTRHETVGLHNVIAIRKGKGDGKAIALTTHYDSTPFGPGFSDDGAGVGVAIELARLYATLEPPERDLMFIFTDGEELGLLGAKKFIEQSDVDDRVGLVINLEARGTDGPSMMFETSPLSRQLIPVFAQLPGKKFGSSLFREIYDRLPNDTDFTIYRRAGKLGFNFAFIGDVKNYHTPADNLDNLKTKSLNHHGENANGLIRELLKSTTLDDEIDQSRKSWPERSLNQEVVYFDLFGMHIIWWPAQLSIWLALVSTAMNLLVASRIQAPNSSVGASNRNGLLTQLKCLTIVLLAIVLVIAAGIGLSHLVRMVDEFSNPWPKNPTPIAGFFWLAGVAICSAATLVFEKLFQPPTAWQTIVFIWCLLAILTAILLPGASHLWIAPTFLAGATGCLLTIRNRQFNPNHLRMLVTAFAIFVGIMWLPMERLFYDAVGFSMPELFFFRVAMASTVVICLCSFLNLGQRFWFTITLVFAAVLLLFVGWSF